MTLPERAKKLISEYSKPITHPNWRDRSWICVGEMYRQIRRVKQNYPNKYYKCCNLYLNFYKNVHNSYSFWDIYQFSLRNGIKETSIVFGISIKVVYDIVMRI